MADQYYVADGRKRGPLTWQEVSNLAGINEIDADVLIWMPHIGEWRRSVDIEELRRFFPGGSLLDAASPNASGPHARLIARAIDLSILAPIGVALVAALSKLGGLLSPPETGEWATFGHLLYLTVGQYLLVWTIVTLSLSVFMALAGTTPGKAILGIKVRMIIEGTPLWFYVKRELKIWALVLCFGLPLPALLEVGRQYRLLRSRQPTLYDFGLAAVEGRPSRLRLVIALCIAPISAAATIGLMVTLAETIHL